MKAGVQAGLVKHDFADVVVRFVQAVGNDGEALAVGQVQVARGMKGRPTMYWLLAGVTG